MERKLAYSLKSDVDWMYVANKQRHRNARISAVSRLCGISHNMSKDLSKPVTSLNAAVSEIAETAAVSVVVVEDANLTVVAEANDNSICRILSGSKEFGSDCAKYCGQVYNSALKAAKPLRYRCHAGLECIAVPVAIKGRKPLVAITGRTFSRAGDYRKATERAITGDWKHFPPTRFFENVLLSSNAGAVEKAAKRIASLMGIRPATEEREEAKPVVAQEAEVHTTRQVSVPVRTKPVSGDISKWRSRFSSMLQGDYPQAYRSVLEFISERFGIGSSAWLEVRQNSFEKVHAKGDLLDQKIQISVAADDKALLRLFEKDSSIELKERGNATSDSASLRLFPLSSAGSIRSALVIGDKADDEMVVGSIARFCSSLAHDLEILRLRTELTRREGLAAAMYKFNNSLKDIDTEDFWLRLLQTTAELVQAERGSLMIFDDESQRLVLKAALGTGADAIAASEDRIGERISSKVWQTGKPAVVEDITKLSMAEAPSDWKYRSKSFISYPLLVGERKIGVINLTDRAGAGSFEEFDVELLDSVVPQISVAVDRAMLKSKAGEFEKLSVTDALTGLLNRRYLEQRLEEEIKRSNRHGFSMCFIMIDVDDFKSYNDSFLHPEGDKALRIVGNCLKDTLRGADVAVRYGGEEFSVLLPQTTIEEGEFIAERIRHRIESTRFPHRQVTVSIGIAVLSPEVNSVASLIHAADTALFEAKRSGKNNVHTFGGRASGISNGI